MQPISDAQIVEILKAEGAQPHEIYAFRKTGRMGLGNSVDYWPPELRAEWQAAVDEYRQLEAEAESKAKG
jgi:hypothetical protein